MLAADIEALLARIVFEHIAVAHRGPLETEAEFAQIALEPQIAHHRGDDPRSAQIATIESQLAAITAINWSPSTMAPFSSMMITRSASPSRQCRYRRALPDLACRRAGAVEPTSSLMLNRRGPPHRHHFGAQFPQRRRRHLVGRAIGAIDHDAQAAEVDILGQGALGESM